MADPRVVLTLAAVAGVVVLTVAQRVIRLKPADFAYLLVPLVLAIAIWVPRDVRDVALPVLCGLLLFIESVVAGCIVAAVTFGIGQAVPGGATAPLLGVFAVAGYFAARDARRHLLRMRAAGALVPNERPAGDVEIGGRVSGAQVLALPASEATCVAWWVETSGVVERASDAPIAIQTEAGTAIAYPAEVDASLDGDRLSFLSDDAAAPIIAALEIEPTAAELDDEPSVWLRWLEAGDEVYVVGRPVWEMAPPGVAEGYRDSPALPTFRPDGERRAFIANRPEDRVRRESLWSLWQWAVWGAVCGAIAFTQMLAE